MLVRTGLLDDGLGLEAGVVVKIGGKTASCNFYTTTGTAVKPTTGVCVGSDTPNKPKTLLILAVSKTNILWIMENIETQK